MSKFKSNSTNVMLPLSHFNFFDLNINVLSVENLQAHEGPIGKPWDL